MRLTITLCREINPGLYDYLEALGNRKRSAFYRDLATTGWHNRNGISHVVPIAAQPGEIANPTQDLTSEDDEVFSGMIADLVVENTA